MNFQRLCLLTGLLSLPVTSANAAEITINVPVEITNPPANTTIFVLCQAGVGAPGPDYLQAWRNPGLQGEASTEVPRPAASKNNYSGVVSIKIKPVRDPYRGDLNSATHYKCWLTPATRTPALPGVNPVTGVIPR